MPRRIHGELTAPAGSRTNAVVGPGVAPQPGRRIAYKSDGTIEGSVKYVTKDDNIRNLPAIGASHPDEPAASAHHMDFEFMSNGRVEATVHYHGIASDMGDESRPTIDYPGGVDQLPIELHPKFLEFAGTPENPKNGAVWVDIETGRQVNAGTTYEYAEFSKFNDPENNFFRTEFYFVSRPMVYRTHWSRRRPSLKKAMTVVSSIPGFTNPPGIVDWLIMDTPYRKVGDMYQVTTQYKGSPEPGWSKNGIYE